ncbi:MAG: universal stress protein [Thermosynechococcaceae cyanobacterium]
MNIQLILARLQGAFGQEFHNKPVLLRPGVPSFAPVYEPSSHPTNLVIGYSDSEESHTALDMVFCIAHQMQLASRQSVFIHVVHVLKQTFSDDAMQFTRADLLLWRVRSLAEEWRGAFTTHLCFGDVATELNAVMVAEQADLLVLGCDSVQQPLVQQFPRQTFFPILGIPQAFRDRDCDVSKAYRLPRHSASTSQTKLSALSCQNQLTAAL